MRIAVAILAAGMALLSMPAQAQSGVSVGRGESVIAALDDKRNDGTVLTMHSEQAAFNALERAVATEFNAGQHAEAVGKNYAVADGEHYPEAPAPVAGRLRITLDQIDESGGTLLVIENGYDRALAYRATMHVRGKAQPTDVCLVIPGKRGFENWPYRVDRLDLSDMKLESWSPGDPVRCE